MAATLKFGNAMAAAGSKEQDYEQDIIYEEISPEEEMQEFYSNINNRIIEDSRAAEEVVNETVTVQTAPDSGTRPDDSEEKLARPQALKKHAKCRQFSCAFLVVLIVAGVVSNGVMLYLLKSRLDETEIQRDTLQMSSKNLQTELGELKSLVGPVPVLNGTLQMSLKNLQTELGELGSVVELKLAQNASALNCDFEQGLCTWNLHVVRDYNWNRKNGSTSSSNTGPSGDHTTGAGHYVYTEASNGNPGDTAELVSAIIRPHSELCMELAYNMYGSTMGFINIYVKPVSMAKVLIQHINQTVNSNSWFVRNFTVPAQTRFEQIIIEGVRGSDYKGDAAIDDIKLYPHSC